MSHNTNTLNQLVVQRDGQLDLDWLTELEHEQRIQALRDLGERTLHFAITAPLAVGKGIVWLMTSPELRV